MPPTTFHLVATTGQDRTAFVTTARQLSPSQRPLFLGETHHWIHQPTLSTSSLIGSGPKLLCWDYLLVTTSPTLPEPLQPHLERHWHITAEVADEWLASFADAQGRRSSATPPPLPPGWSPQDHGGLDAALVPSDLEASLSLSSYPLGADVNKSDKIGLKDFIRDFGTDTPQGRRPAPVAMFNLLSYLPGQRARYFEYMAAFQESVGSKYGGEGVFLGLGVSDWSSKAAEGVGLPESDDVGDDGGGVGWQDVALVWYPSLWHFGKMLDDPAYADADRRFKRGVLRDNPIVCCTEVVL